MQKYEAIEQGILEKDVAALKEAIGNICYTCRDFSDGEFDRIVRYVESNGITLMDDGIEGNPTISSQKGYFTDDDFSRAVFELKRNFCKERIDDVKKIGKTLYKDVAKEVEELEAVDSNNKIQAEAIDPKKAQSHQKKRGLMSIILAAVVVIIVLILFILKNK